MKILFINTQSVERCGVAEFGRTMAAELIRAGLPVTVYDGSYPVIYDRGHRYFPEDLDDYDWLHFNWHPGTLNHYVPQLLPPEIWQQHKISIYYHDLPPWSTCPLDALATVKIAAEPADGYVYLPYPAIEDADLSVPIIRPTTIGWSGVRGDGQQQLREVCTRRGWTLNDGSDRWRSTREEIRRLSRSTLNVLWYAASGRGRSLALMTASAARRPLLINPSSMFVVAGDYPWEIYRADRHPSSPYLEQAIEQVLDEIWKGEAMVPDEIVTDYGWTQAAMQLKAVWGC